MPADEMTPAHYKAMKACMEVAAEGGPEDIVNMAEEGMRILLQHNPGLDHLDPLDQLGEHDRHLLVSYTDASNQFFWEQDQGTFPANTASKAYREWQQLMIERLNR